MPTLLEWAGLPMPDERPRPGCSAAALWRGELAGADRPVFIGDEYGPVRMVRTAEWKYVHRYPYGKHELYHLAEDPDETVNRVDDPSCKETVQALKTELERWFAAYADPAVDGTRAAVYGVGQLGLAGARGDGTPAFHSRFRFADGRG
jgi:arylsulfatase A-like enzyme